MRYAQPLSLQDDPYHDVKYYHLAAHIGPGGEVSPLCAKTPRKINLKRELWTITESAVTCPRCLRKMKARREGEK